MGWLDKGNQNTQIHGFGNIRDLDRIHQRERKRKIFLFLDFISIISILIGILIIYSFKDYITGFVFIGIGIIILVYFISRKLKRKPRHKNHRRHRRH